MTAKSKHPFPSVKQTFTSPVLFFGFGFGSGLIRPAPGTWGTLLGLLLFIPLMQWSIETAWAVFFLSLVFGSYLCGKSAEIMNVHDHGGIVWDEFAGIWMVLLLLPEQHWLYWAAAFVVFRFFDIVKPYPIKRLDQTVSGGFGIMVDDLAAAVYAIAFIWLLHYGFFA